MDHECITINNGDQVTLDRDPEGELGIKIQNVAFVEQPRWLHVDVAGHHDRRHAIDELIGALEQLRDMAQNTSE